MAVGIVSAASAQHVRVGGGFGYGGGVVVHAYAPAYYGYGYGFYPGFYWGLGYPYWTYPYGYPYGHVPTKLESQVSSIKADYADRIESVKADNTLSRKDKRQQIRNLKNERDEAVANAVRSYWRTPAQNGPAPQNQNAPSQQ
ncbi:hypothetical protein [Dinghuibacter silviterrae]|nr:hypothetical protein [Dinghuibacter silviterrae]